MKKTAAIFLAMLMLLSMHALAFMGSGYPAWDGVELPDNRIGASFGSERLLLEFDPAAEYSFLKDGAIQACFFVYDASEQHYLEMYIVLPEDIAAGDVISNLKPGKGANASAISLFEVYQAGETAYYASITYRGAMPENSTMEITIEKAEITAESAIVSGRLSANLCRYMGDLPTGEVLEIADGNFHFSLPLTGAEIPQLPGTTQAPAASAQPMLPSKPAFTLPPDYIEL